MSSASLTEVTLLNSLASFYENSMVVGLIFEHLDLAGGENSNLTVLVLVLSS